MVGIVALGRPDNHNLTGRFNEPYARRTPPVPPSDGHLIIRDTPERWTISTPTSDIASVLSVPLAPVHPYTSHRSVPFTTSSPARVRDAHTLSVPE